MASEYPQRLLDHLSERIKSAAQGGSYQIVLSREELGGDSHYLKVIDALLEKGYKVRDDRVDYYVSW